MAFERAEELQAGRAAHVQRPLAGLEEQVAQDQDVSAAALGLRAVLDEVVEAVVGDDAVVAADHVDARAAADALDEAAQDVDVVDARELDAVVVAAGADVLDREVAQDDVVGGCGVGAAIVDVDAVAGRTAGRSGSRR